jgi:hypothetical protein
VIVNAHRIIDARARDWRITLIATLRRGCANSDSRAAGEMYLPGGALGAGLIQRGGQARASMVVAPWLDNPRA